MSTPAIRAVLVDDEVLARLSLRQALAAHPQVDIAGECGNAADALQAIRLLHPDLVILDIQMPGMNGFELLRRLPADALPLVVFASAFDQHALQAFDAGAVDYLLKPIDQARFDLCMQRIGQRLHRLSQHATPPRHTAFAAAEPFVQRFSIRVGEHLRVVRVEDIDWIAADGNYVRLHLAGTALLHRDTLKNVEATLDPARFLRIHRSTMVNIDRIKEWHPLFHGDAEIVLHDGTRLTLSRRFRDGARHRLGLR
ncbi:LytR/AlgR family response regulator transcription factor [Dyella silvatica]|uniref:LytR/AlgR family response regulator transcription factor n=1 Tax=Dyella silvatica TaxID=2992128 RepID=UPI00225A5C5B|nr:LytTR family transcriptional regulator DNA-binding domain-containing protein [Dyella silvatica]